MGAYKYSTSISPQYPFVCTSTALLCSISLTDGKPTMKSCIISVDGVNFSRRFIAKEISVHLLDDGTTRHMLLKTPTDFWMTSADRKTHNFAVHVLGTIPLTSHQLGSLDYYSHAGALDSLKDHRIFVVGEIAEKFVRNIVPHADIWNIQELTSFTYPKTLPTACCGVVHNPRYCSLAKLHYIRDFINRNPPSEWNERAY